MKMLAYIQRALKYFPRFKFNIIKWDVIDEIARAVSVARDPVALRWADLGISAAFVDERPVEYFEFFRILAQQNCRDLMLMDAGSVLNFERLVPHISNVKQVDIFTLAPEETNATGANMAFTYGDLRNIPYEDNRFGMIISLSTLEHVGLDNTKLYSDAVVHRESDPISVNRAMTELYRVTAPGGRLLISVPFGQRITFEWLRIFNEQDLDVLVGESAWSDVKKRFYRNTDMGWVETSAADCAECTYSSPLIGEDLDPRRPGAHAVAILELKK
jgi:SAM-dependent methyltransferase